MAEINGMSCASIAVNHIGEILTGENFDVFDAFYRQNLTPLNF